MYYTQFNLTDQDIVQHICTDFIFPVKNHYGSNNLYVSRDVGSTEAIETMVQIHNLVEQIAKSEQQAIKFETTIHGKRCLGITPVGEVLYRILLKQHRFSPPPKQQRSEALNLWEEVTHRILGSNVCFLGDPIHLMNDQGVTEGELVEATAIRLREATRRQAYMSKREQRRKDAQRICTATTKLVTRLLEQHPGLFGLRVDLMYSQGYAEKIGMKDSLEHIRGLIEALKDDLWFGKSVGYFWTRRFLSEAGYRFNLVLLFDPNITPIHLIDGTYVLQQWLARTKSAGLDYVLPDGFCNADELLRYIECSKKTALYLRLIPDAKFLHFGMSELPSIKSLSDLEQDPTSTSGEDGGFGRNQPESSSTHLGNRFK